MNKVITKVITKVMICLSILGTSCSSGTFEEEDTNSPLETSLNLVSPSGMRIAPTLTILKGEILGILKQTKVVDFEILSISYLKQKEPYVADIQYLLNGVNVGNVIKTNDMSLKVMPHSKIITTHLKTKSSSETGDKTTIFSCRRIEDQKLCPECKTVIDGKIVKCDCTLDCELIKY